ncbi:hypothetical protein HK100_007834 [Physocladia obscura]|uniref:VTT domain-containing protein n=1 Tax=Physocladia obscura TaxID=109957 RepID=A0AAD5SRA4_9FUNG|nr:hypothetical protein HK100_007834 [Physocladia obscura]
MKSLDGALAREGFKIVLLIRFSPIAPFGIANYMFSLTSIPTSLLQLATFVGNIPGAISYTLLGSYIGTLSGISNDGTNPGDGGKPGFDFDIRTKAFAGLASGCALIWTVVYIGAVARGALRLATIRTEADLEVDVTALSARNSVDLESGVENEAGGGEIERAPLMDDDAGSNNGNERRRMRPIESLPVQMSVSDGLDNNDGPIDANGYTAEDRLLIKRTFYGLVIGFVVGLIGILIFI